MTWKGGLLLNVPALEKLLQNFYQISGMEVAVVNTQYRNVVSCRCPGNNFCASIHKSAKCVEVCMQSDLSKLRYVDETKKSLTYICPFGIFEAITPIMKNGSVIAYLFFAMGMETRDGCDELPLHQALKFAPALNAEHLRQCIIEMPHYSRKTLEAYADLLRLMAQYIEVNDLISDDHRSLGVLIQNYVQQNIGNKITLGDLSWNLHCSTVTLTEHFKREFGVTIMQYVARERMRCAEAMLAEEDFSIREIAERCGYPDVEYFSRSFKSLHGVSPREWRKNQKQEAKDR